MLITKSTARKLAVAAQGLDGGWKLPRGLDGAAEAVRRLGYVQIDTIAVVERAHHHTLWSRQQSYRPAMLHKLHAEKRLVFEYWSHAASYLPLEDYRFSLPRMKGFADSPRTRRFLKDNAKLVRHVRSRIRKEGALRSADFATPNDKKRGSWWDWKPAKRVLETLFSAGELMIAERRNFQRLYDLTERVLPTNVETSPPESAELARFTVRRVLAGQGVSGLRHWSIRRGQGVQDALRELIDAGEVAKVRIEGLDGKVHYALTESLAATPKRRRTPKVHILSPFDNLVIWRDRLRDLFEFDCKLECYTPAAKRKWGYFCLPILWGERFVGRLDPKADRESQTLLVRKLIFEPDFKDYDALLGALARKLRVYAEFNGCTDIVIEATSPSKVRPALNKELRLLV